MYGRISETPTAYKIELTLSKKYLHGTLNPEIPTETLVDWFLVITKEVTRRSNINRLAKNLEPL